MSRSIDSACAAHLLVGVGLRDRARAPPDPSAWRRPRAARARSGVLARDPRCSRSRSSSGISCTNCQADGGVGVLVTGLGAESIEQCHTRSSLTGHLRGGSACELEFIQLRDDVAAVGRGADLLVDVQNAAVRSDVKRPARREPARREHAVGPRHFFRRVAQNRIRQPERLREPRVHLRRVDARREIAARPAAATLRRSTPSDLHSAVQPPVNAFGNQAIDDGPPRQTPLDDRFGHRIPAARSRAPDRPASAQPAIRRALRGDVERLRIAAAAAVVAIRLSCANRYRQRPPLGYAILMKGVRTRCGNRRADFFRLARNSPILRIGTVRRDCVAIGVVQQAGTGRTARRRPPRRRPPGSTIVYTRDRRQ